jgi:hypothetical protein
MLCKNKRSREPYVLPYPRRSVYVCVIQDVE